MTKCQIEGLVPILRRVKERKRCRTRDRMTSGRRACADPRRGIREHVTTCQVEGLVPILRRAKERTRCRKRDRMMSSRRACADPEEGKRKNTSPHDVKLKGLCLS